MRRSIRLIALFLVAAPVVAFLGTRDAETVPLYSSRSGLMCQNCHFDPNGGGPRNAFGFAYARNRHELEPEPEGSPWKDLDLTNKVSDTFPLTFGVNQRFMLLTNNTESYDGIDRLGFFNMENSLQFAFQPHQRLSLVYAWDAFGGSSSAPASNRDAFGMIGGFPWNGYFKAGRFRVPFGLRMDDHTVATRNSFLDFSTSERFLPYDPRDPDMGVEIGGDNGSLFGRASFTNGGQSFFGRPFAETKAVKLGMNNTWYQGAVSFYDQYNKETTGGPKRATRWGYYGMFHRGPAVLLGEVAAGTDEAEPVVPGAASGPKTNRLAAFAELDYTPRRWLNTRVRWDYLEMDRSSDETIRDLSTHSRYAFEVDYVPVPFAELRGVIRRIDHKDEALDDETQGYLQFHFSY